MISVSKIGSSLVYAKIKGWKQTVLYLLTLTLSSSAAYIYFDDEIYSPYMRKQKKLAAMEKELIKKQQTANNFESLQLQLDNTEEKPSCVNTLKTAALNSKTEEQWSDCIGEESVVKRLNQFSRKSQSVLVTFNSPWAVLESLAAATRETDIDNVKYKITSLSNNDGTETMPLILSTTIQADKILSYMERLGSYCNSCLIKIHTLQYNKDTQNFSATFKLSLYLDVAVSESKKWQQAINNNQLSGDDLASYKRPNTATN